MLPTTMIAGLLVLFAGFSPAGAAFDLTPLAPAERGVAGSPALGMVGGPEESPGVAQSGGLKLRQVQVYGFRPFGLEEADFAGTSVELGLGGRLDLGLACQVLSVLGYKEQTYQVSCAWRSPALRLTPSLRFGTLRFDGSVVDRVVLLDFALEARPVPGVKVAVSTRNPFGLGLMESGERCPTDITAGLGYALSRRLGFGVRIRKEGGFPTSVATGIELCPAGMILLRTGLQTDPKEFYLGLGLKAGRIAMDFSSSLHLDLGITHEAGLTYRGD
jgi:hypothetical protein